MPLMPKQVQLELQIGASFSAAIELDTDQTGRTHIAHIRETATSSTVKMAFSTAAGTASCVDRVLTLSDGADVTSLISIAADSALWVVDVKSIGADPDDIRIEVVGSVFARLVITRTSDPTPSPSALGFVAYSEPQMLSEPQKAQARSNIGADSGGVTDYNDLTNLPTLGTAAARDVPSTGDAAAGEVVKGNDTRLTNARTPTAHTHPLSDLAQSGATVGDNPKWNGTAWVPAAGGGMSIGAPVAGATAGRVPFIDLDGNLTQSSSFRWLLGDPGAVYIDNILAYQASISNLVLNANGIVRIKSAAVGRVAIEVGYDAQDGALTLAALNLKPLTSGTLPIAPVMYDQCLVVDALTPTKGSPYVGGGTSPANVIWISPDWIVL